MWEETATAQGKLSTIQRIAGLQLTAATLVTTESQSLAPVNYENEFYQIHVLTHRKEAKRVKNKYSQFQSAFNQKVIIFQSIWINMTCSQEEWWIIHVYNYSFGEQCQGDIELFINLKHKCRWSIPSRSNRSLTECSNFRCLSKISLIKTIQPYNISH